MAKESYLENQSYRENISRRIQEDEAEDRKRKVSRGARLLSNLGLTWEDLRGKKIIDIGAGAAHIAHEGRKNGVNGIISIDKFPYRDDTEGERGKNYVKADARHLPLKGGSVDLVVSTGFLAPPNSPDQDYLESARVLKPGGRLIIWPASLHLDAHVRGVEEEKRLLLELEQKLQKSLGSVFFVKLFFDEKHGKTPWAGDYRFELTKVAND